MIDHSVFFLPVRELAARIKSKKLTSTELTEACLDRLDKVGRRYNAVVTLMRDSALAEARVADNEIKAGKYRGPLHGIPYGVKDLLATKGVPTTWGAAPYKDQVFDYDATAVTRLREAGAVLVAKLAMVELAGGMGYNHADASFTGPGSRRGTRSSGAAARRAVRAPRSPPGCVPFAIGSETSGSILTPSAFCGVTGLRPTYGPCQPPRRDGAVLDARQAGAHGAHAPTTAALVLAAIAGARSRGRVVTRVRRFEYRERAAAASRAARRGAQGLHREGAAGGARELRGDSMSSLAMRSR